MALAVSAGSVDSASSRIGRHPARAVVTAILLPRSGPDDPADDPAARDRLLSAVGAQTRRPDAVLQTNPADVQGDAGHAVLIRRPRPGSDGREPWVWLVRDGAVPQPRALELLLRAVEVGPSIGIAGCKQVEEPGSALLDAGFTSTRFGRHIAGADWGEVDQGQLNHRQDVLAVSTAGMLIRRELFERLRGTDPALHGPAADLDLCRRAWLAGQRVVVVPDAVVRADSRGLVSRRDAAHVRLVHCPAPLLPLVALAVAAGAAIRFLLAIGGRSPRRGLRDVRDTVRALLRPGLVWRSRRRAARTRAVPRRTLTPLLAGHGDTLRWHRERWQRGHVAAAPTPDELPAGALGPGAELPRTGRARRRWGWPLLLTSASGIVSVAALHRLLGPYSASGGVLFGAPDSLPELWANLRSGWRATSLGQAGPADPFGYVLSAATVLAGGSSRLAALLLVVAALPLAALGGWLAAGRGTRSRMMRAGTSVVWASAPALLLAIGSGRVGAVVVHVAVPFVVWAVVACVQAPRLRHAWTPAAVGGAALAVVTASAPALLAPVLLVLAATGAVHRRRAAALAWVALPSLALLGPWLVAAVQAPRVLLAGPGLPLASTPADAWAQLLGQPVLGAAWPRVDGVPGEVAPLVAGGVAWLLALAALGSGGPAGQAVRLGWFTAAAGLATALVTGHVVTGTDGTYAVSGWSGSALSLTLAGLAVAVVAGLSPPSLDHHPSPPRWRRAGVAGLSLAVLLAPVATLALWTANAVTDPRATAPSRGGEPQLPEVVRDAARSGDQVRVLVLRASPEGATASLVRGGQPAVGAFSALVSARAVAGVGSAPWSDVVAAEPDAADQALQLAVATLVSGRADPRPLLSDLAVGYVVVLPGEGADRLSEALGSLAGLASSGQSEDVRAWRVRSVSGQGGRALDRPAAVRVLNSAGAVTAVLRAEPLGADTNVPAAADGQPRVLAMAERADGGWSATLDGKPLTATTRSGWAQAFELPPQGGHLVLRYQDPVQPVWSAVQLVVGALTLLLAVPLPRGRRTISGAR